MKCYKNGINEKYSPASRNTKITDVIFPLGLAVINVIIIIDTNNINANDTGKNNLHTTFNGSSICGFYSSSISCPSKFLGQRTRCFISRLRITGLANESLVSWKLLLCGWAQCCLSSGHRLNQRRFLQTRPSKQNVH